MNSPDNLQAPVSEHTHSHRYHPPLRLPRDSVSRPHLCQARHPPRHRLRRVPHRRRKRQHHGHRVHIALSAARRIVKAHDEDDVSFMSVVDHSDGHNSRENEDRSAVVIAPRLNVRVRQKEDGEDDGDDVPAREDEPGISVHVAAHGSQPMAQPAIRSARLT